MWTSAVGFAAAHCFQPPELYDRSGISHGMYLRWYIPGYPWYIPPPIFSSQVWEQRDPPRGARLYQTAPRSVARARAPRSAAAVRGWGDGGIMEPSRRRAASAAPGRVVPARGGLGRAPRHRARRGAKGKAAGGWRPPTPGRPPPGAPAGPAECAQGPLRPHANNRGMCHDLCRACTAFSFHQIDKTVSSWLRN